MPPIPGTTSLLRRDTLIRRLRETPARVVICTRTDAQIEYTLHPDARPICPSVIASLLADGLLRPNNDGLFDTPSLSQTYSLTRPA